MEAAAKSIKSLISVLPDRPHQLSISPDTRYQIQPNDTRLEEDVIRPLQYMTYLFGVDRGLLLTRAYPDIRDEENHAPKPAKPPLDPNKPRTKVSLSDYKKKKQDIDSSTSTPSSKPVPAPVQRPTDKERERERIPTIKKEESPSVDNMLKQTTLKKAHPSLPPKPDVRRPGTEPSPERKKRPSDLNDDRAAKRTKLDSASSNLTRGVSKSDTSSRPSDRERSSVNSDKKPSKELKPSPMPAASAKSILSNPNTHGASPRPNSQANGSSQKPVASKGSTPKKEKVHSGSKELKSIPMLSPLGPELSSRIPGYELSPRAKPSDKDVKSQPKRQREEVESSTPKRKVELPPLLSPTLPPIVREAQAIGEKKLDLSKDVRQRGIPLSDAPSTAKKAPMKSIKEESIQVEIKKEKREEHGSKIVKLKYPKRLGKTISRLLALAPKKKSEAVKKDYLEPPKRDDRTGRDRSDSLEPPPATTARKRPRTATDASDLPLPSAIKHPRASEAAQPSTPARHPTAMQRVASSSSQAGTPGVTNNLTPAAPVLERRSASVDPERANRLKLQHNTLAALGTKLKHQRDRIIKPRDGSGPPNPTTRERNAVMATVIQSIAAYLAGFKAMDDMRDAERKVRDPNTWKSMLPLLRVYRADCSNSTPLNALFLRLHCVTLVCFCRSLASLGLDNAAIARGSDSTAIARGPDNAAIARDLFQATRDQEQTWKLAGDARRRLEDSQGGDDGGLVARLLDRIGPWSTVEEVVSITLKILRRVIRVSDETFTPEPELVQACEPMTNGL